MINKAEQLIVRSASNSFDAMKMTTYADDYIVQGKSFTVNGITTINAETILNFLIKPGTSVSMFVLPFTIKSQSTYIQVRIYEDTDYTGGTAVSATNRNRISTNTLQATITTGATGSDKGDLIISHAIFGSSLPQGTAYSGAGGSANAFILDSSKKYLVEIENTDGSNSTVVEYNAPIYEI